ncbi:hypothetical protein C5167_025251 [Papaver somniferum]|uniref:Uncharacterized protein n=1 Tax=Papaver somniferum TaxID=3469 RepID=A0A4Y7JR06_PAPSO|nr:hypothetical protein C5167_025251 [Papaver somniferum]
MADRYVFWEEMAMQQDESNSHIPRCKVGLWYLSKE